MREEKKLRRSGNARKEGEKIEENEEEVEKEDEHGRKTSRMSGITRSRWSIEDGTC